MKKVIEVEEMCCKRCAERAEKKLLLIGVNGAKAKFKKGIIFVETDLPDETLKAYVEEAGFPVKDIRPRKGLFG